MDKFELPYYILADAVESALPFLREGQTDCALNALMIGQAFSKDACRRAGIEPEPRPAPEE